MLVTRHVRLEIPHWSRELKIAVLGDLHIGSPHVGLDKLQKIVDRTNAENPQLIVLLGDYVIGGPRGGRGEPGGTFIEPELTAQRLKNLRAPLGVFAVIGNHDRWYDGDRVTRALTSEGIHVLENQAVRIDDFWLAGVGDAWTSNPDIEGTLAQVTDDNPVLLITHNPNIFPQVPPRVSLTLGAHTHGGQVKFPIYGTLIDPKRLGYAAGHYVEQGRNLFVTTGIGTSIYPARLGVPPEIAILTLEPGPTF